MPIRFSTTEGPVLAMTRGVPPNFTGSLLNHVDTYYCLASFGYVVAQHIHLPAMQLTKVFVHWTKPERVVCHHDDSCSMFTRIVSGDSLHHFIKGTGEIHVSTDQFVTLAASSWKNVILPVKAGDYSFIDISWTPRFVEDCIQENHALYERISKINCEGFPEIMFGVPLDNSSGMKITMANLQNIDFTEKYAELTLRCILKSYFAGMIEETINRYSIKKKMRAVDWDVIQMAKELIDNNPDQRYTVRELSGIVGMNEFKLKKLFPKITGKKIDEYRKYQLCIKAGKQIVQKPDEPLKNFYADAGYTSLTTFIRGFKKLCCCTPGELRQSSWDLQSLMAKNE